MLSVISRLQCAACFAMAAMASEMSACQAGDITPCEARTPVPDPGVVPRYAGIATFVKLPMLAAPFSTQDYDIAVFGIPYDNAATYRPGARFGPGGVRQASKKLRAAGYQPGLGMFPFRDVSVVDAGDAPITPFDIRLAMSQATDFASEVLGPGEDFKRPIMIGGDHLTPIATLRALHRKRQDGVCLIHFDAHMDTGDSYFGERYTHGTTFRRAVDEGLLTPNCSISIGLRGGWATDQDLREHNDLGFASVTSDQMSDMGLQRTIESIWERIAGRPSYITVDIDVLDPAYAPGTGTLEPGGLSSRELLRIIRGLRGLCVLGADVVEVAPSYDHMETTQLVAAYVLLDLIGIVGDAKIGKFEKRCL